jgi:hypothetical protein
MFIGSLPCGASAHAGGRTLSGPMHQLPKFGERMYRSARAGPLGSRPWSVRCMSASPRELLPTSQHKMGRPDGDSISVNDVRRPLVLLGSSCRWYTSNLFSINPLCIPPRCHCLRCSCSCWSHRFSCCLLNDSLLCRRFLNAFHNISRPSGSL